MSRYAIVSNSDYNYIPVCHSGNITPYLYGDRRVRYKGNNNCYRKTTSLTPPIYGHRLTVKHRKFGMVYLSSAACS